MTTPPRRPSPASRATRRSRRSAPSSGTFLERNRRRLLWGGGVAAFVGLVFVGLVVPSFTPAYDCTTLFDPTPAPSFVAPSAAPVASGATPAPAVTAPPPGFVQDDMGHVHTRSVGDKVRYASCPPASGKHYPVTPNVPIKGGLYGPNDPTVPQGWVHNLEHGAIVLLYRCLPEDDCGEAQQASLQALLERWPDSPICKTAPGEVTPVITRFDQMATRYAAVVWDVILPMDTLDEALLFEFYARQGDRFQPEFKCTEPTPTPGPTPTAGPATPTPVPSVAASPGASPAASAAASAGTSPVPSPAASPAASAAPSPS